MTLYLKYRPQNLDELDADSVRESLKKIFSSGKIPHAFLFAGPKGIGKTSAARIIAKILNCESKKPPCGKCMQCTSIAKGSNLDVIELDAASHRGIEEARMLRDAVKLSPAKAKKKIYIIDEAHMLTPEASNALLKTLEEPPEHVVFILATTNPEKLIETIRSRATVINFEKATASEIVHSLKRVAKGEKLKIDDEVLKIIARFSRGAFRDAVKILEQLLSEKIKLEKETVEEFLFRHRTFDVENFIEELGKKNTKELLGVIGKSVEKGNSCENMILEILTQLRLGLISKMGVGEETLQNFTKDELINLIELFSEASRQISDSPIEELPLEVAVIKWCLAEPDLAPRDHAEPEKIRPKFEGKNIDETTWKTILGSVRPINASIEALLRSAKPLGFDGKTLTLGVFYRFHKERLEDGHHRRVLEEVVGSVLGTPTRVTCMLTEPPAKKVQEEVVSETVLTESKDEDIIKVAEEIFGN